MAKTIPTMQQRQKDAAEKAATLQALHEIEMRTAVLRGVLEGKTELELAEQLGVHWRTIQNYKRRSLNSLAKENRAAAERMRALEGARLDAAHAAIWKEVLAGNLRAIEAMLSISTKRRSLFALDVPPPPETHEVTGKDGTPLVVTLAFDAPDTEQKETTVIEGESIRLLPAAGEDA